MTCIGPLGSLAAELAGLVSRTGRPPQLRRVTIRCVSIRVQGADAPRELEEVPMPIVGGLDIHRNQITFDYLDTTTGEVRRGQIDPADTAAARGRKRHAKTDKTDSRHLRQLLADGRLPECWIPPAQILECRALLETYHDLRREHTAWV